MIRQEENTAVYMVLEIQNSDGLKTDQRHRRPFGHEAAGGYFDHLSQPMGTPGRGVVVIVTRQKKPSG